MTKENNGFYCPECEAEFDDKMESAHIELLNGFAHEPTEFEEYVSEFDHD